MAATTRIFDAKVQEEVDYTLAVDANGEIVATSTASDSVLKFPAGLSRAELDDLISQHSEANQGQQVVSSEDVQAQEANREASRQLLRDFGASDAEANEVYRPEPAVDTTADAPNHQFDGADEGEHLAEGVQLVRPEDRQDENPQAQGIDPNEVNASNTDRPTSTENGAQPAQEPRRTGQAKQANQGAENAPAQPAQATGGEKAADQANADNK